MSRVGKDPVQILSGVTLNISGNTISAKGPKGSLSRSFSELISFSLEGNQVIVKPAGDMKASELPNKVRAMWGLTRKLIYNMVQGVSVGYSKSLEVNGTGYKANVADGLLQMSLGYSHDVLFAIPQDIDIKCDKNIITVSGFDKEKVGQIAAEIRSKRPPEPYKGKGIKYVGENIRRKVAKKK